MISTVISYLNTRLGLTNLFETSYGLTELVTDAEGQATPKEYCTTGEWKDVTNFDKHNGISYWRKDGQVRQTEAASGNVACDKFLSIDIPLVLVCVVPKKKMQDDAYTPDAIAAIITKNLSLTSATLKSTLTARRVNIQVTSYDTNIQTIFDRELTDVVPVNITYKYALISLSVSVQIEIKSSCIPTECDESTACEQLIASLTEDELLTCILPSYDFADADTLANLTAQQRSDLTDELCTPCADATVEINGTTYDTVASGATIDVPVLNTSATPVGTINAGVSVVVPNATITIKNSANTTIDSGSVASGASAIFTITDSTAVIKNSAGTTLQTEAIPAEVSEDITIADTAVSNSDDSYVSVVISGVAKELPDITYTDALGVAAAYPSVKNITATRVNAMTCDNLNGEMTDAQRQFIQRVNTLKTGQTTSYRTGDDGDLEKGRLPTFTTLTCNNGFGNTNRFTDELGGQTYTNNLVCDWATGLMWYRVLSAVATWNTAIDNAEASTQASYTDWRIPNMTEMISVANMGVSGGLDYSPFNQAALASNAYLWTSTTAPGLTTWAQTWWYGHPSAQYRGILEPIIKTNNTQVKYYLCRNFTLSDLGL